VLVAEDDVRLGRLLAQSLTKADWEVVVVHGGLAAFDRGLVGDEDGPLNLPGESFCAVGRECRSLLILVWPPHRRRSCPHRMVLAASSSEPALSVGLACRSVGAWRRQMRHHFG
jgi:hypothetical protein